MDGCPASAHPASAQYTDPDGEFLVLVGMLIGGYTAYNQAKDLGMSDSSVFAAAAFGAAIGAVTGGVGSSVAAVTFKQGVAQAFKATTTEAVSKAAQGSVVGGITGSVTSAAIQAVGDDGIDGTQVAVDGIKGGFAGLAGGTTTAFLGESTAAKLISTAVSTKVEDDLNIEYKKNEK